LDIETVSKTDVSEKERGMAAMFGH
jgi:hypothetical protein